MCTRRRFLKNQVRHIGRAKVPALAKNGFDGVIPAPSGKKALFINHDNAGQGAGRLLDVVFGVMAFAERKELHHFTSKIFIGHAHHAGVQIQVLNHRRRVGHDLDDLRVGLLKGGAQQIDMVVNALRVLDLTLRDHEYVGQKHRQVFLRGIFRLGGESQPGLHKLVKGLLLELVQIHRQLALGWDGGALADANGRLVG